MALGKNVKRLRKARGMDQGDLSRLSGVPVGSISAMEVRDSVRSQFAAQLAKALGVTTDELMAEDVTATINASFPPLTASASISVSNPALTPVDTAQAAMNFDRQSRVSLSKTALDTIDFADFAVLDANSLQVVQGLFRCSVEHSETTDQMAAAIKNIIESSKAKRQSQMATEAPEAKQYTPDQRRTGTHS